METVRAAAQHHRVAALEAQRAGVGGDVRAALVDHADDAERRRDALDREAVRPLEGGEHAPDRVGQRGDLLDAARDCLDAGGVESQTVEESVGDALGARLREIARVGVEHLGRALRVRFARRRCRARVLVSAGALASCRAAARASAPIARIAARTSCAISPEEMALVMSGLLDPGPPP